MEWEKERNGCGNNAFEECILSALYGWRYLQPMGFLPLSAGKCHFEHCRIEQHNEGKEEQG